MLFLETFRFIKNVVAETSTSVKLKKTIFEKQNDAIFRNISFYQECRGRDLHLSQAKKKQSSKNEMLLFLETYRFIKYVMAQTSSTGELQKNNVRKTKLCYF